MMVSFICRMLIVLFVGGLPSLLWGKVPIFQHPLERKTQEKSDVLLKADSVTHEDELSLVIARGNVQIADGKEVIQADTVSYNKNLNTVTAIGHVIYHRENGDVITGNYLELGDHFKKGFIKNVHLLTPSEDRIAAVEADRDGEITVMKRAVYSPCKLCKKNRRDPLPWQIRANKVTRDAEKKTITYQHVIFDFYGMPVLYLPWFRHPDPSVERESGFLMPLLSNNTELGMVIGAPYYWSISPQQEMIIRPIIMTKDNPMLSLDYERLGAKSVLFLSGSIIDTNNVTGQGSREHQTPRKVHSHLIANGRYDINHTWRTSGQVEYASNPTYLKKYYFLNKGKYIYKNFLNTNLNVEGFSERNYITLAGYSFQNMRQDLSNRTIPTVAPYMEGAIVSEPGRWGERWSFDGNQMYLTRRKGTKVERLVAQGALDVPYTTSFGVVSEAQVALRGDLYNIRDFMYAANRPAVNETRGRVIPSFSWLLRYPFAKTTPTNQFILEPIAEIVALPNHLNNPKYPNEDSQDFEFDSTQLFQRNRFTGFDKVDDGQRANYGVRFNWNRQKGQSMKVLFGQSYSFNKPHQFDPYSGISQGQSSYVGALELAPHPDYKFVWRTRFSHKTYKMEKNIFKLSAGPSIAHLNLDYVQIARDFYQGQFVKRELVALTFFSQFHENWGAGISETREMGYKRGDLLHGAALQYHNDCFKIRLDYFQTFYKDRDVVPSKTIMLTLGLKNLGEYSTGQLSMGSFTQDLRQKTSADPLVARP